MENVEEFLYRAFCAALFALAVSLLFVLGGRQSLLLEKAEKALSGSVRPDSVLFERRDGSETKEHALQVTGGELLLLFYDPLPANIEIDGSVLKKGELYDGPDYVRPDARYEKELIYVQGEPERIIFRVVEGNGK